MQELVFWQNMPNHLQSAHIRALNSVLGCRVTLVTQEAISSWRKNMGWSTPNFGSASLVVAPADDMIMKLISESTRETIHIFSGVTGYPMVRRAFKMALHTDAQIGLMSEAGVWSGGAGRLRKFRAQFDALRYAGHVAFVLAIGHLGLEWFRQTGYPSTKLYPYGYFLENPVGNSPRQFKAATEVPIHLVFIGQLVRRKGVDVLLSALRDLRDLNWHLSIIGDGAERAALETMACKINLADKISFEGALPNQVATQRLATADLLVLPSRWDGWGAVVNEALMQGVPVIASDRCGAVDLLHSTERGEAFPAESATNLKAVLKRRIEEGKLRPEQSARIRNWSQNITGVAAANYLLEVINAVHTGIAKPQPPWYT